MVGFERPAVDQRVELWQRQRLRSSRQELEAVEASGRGTAHLRRVGRPDDKVWLSEWAANAIVRFDSTTEKFESFPSNRANSDVRQMLGRKGETWIAESGTERIRVIRHAARTN